MSSHKLPQLGDDDRYCTKCSWTLYTGGMDEDGHASLGHGLLVSKAEFKALQPPATRSCTRCGLSQTHIARIAGTPCRIHNGEKQNFKRIMAAIGARVSFTWSCCGAAYDEAVPQGEKGPSQHSNGCQTMSAHQF